MTVREILFRYIHANAPLTYPIQYGIATQSPAYVMQTVTPGEVKESVCDEQGESGEYLFQFTFSAGQSDDGWSQFGVENQIETLKNYIKTLVGQISFSGNSVRLWNARVSGVRPLGDPDGLYYGAIIEYQVSWSLN